MLASGEYAYNQAKLQEASAWITNNPGRFATLTWQRFLAFWFYTPDRSHLPGQHIPAGIAIIWLVMPLSIAGLWMLFKTDRISAGLCLAWLILFPPDLLLPCLHSPLPVPNPVGQPYACIVFSLRIGTAHLAAPAEVQYRVRSARNFRTRRVAVNL